jgi:hypothetical protein
MSSQKTTLGLRSFPKHKTVLHILAWKRVEHALESIGSHQSVTQVIDEAVESPAGLLIRYIRNGVFQRDFPCPLNGLR